MASRFGSVGLAWWAIGALCLMACGRSAEKSQPTTPPDSAGAAGSGVFGGGGARAAEGGSGGGSAASVGEGMAGANAMGVGGSAQVGGVGGAIAAGGAGGAPNRQAGGAPWINGLDWLDTNDQPILGTQGNIVRVSDDYYWFGSRQELGAFVGVSVYHSRDLRHWQFVRDVLRSDSDPALHSVYIGRPNVIFNAATGKYVMWMYEDIENAKHQHAAVAVSDTPDGEYTYLGGFRPLHGQGVSDPSDSESGYTSRDCTAFVDDDGKGYFVSNSNAGADLNIYALTADYLGIDHLVATLFAGDGRQKPVLFKRHGVYVLITQKRPTLLNYPPAFATSSELAGGWSASNDLGDPAQLSVPAAALAVPGGNEASFLYTADSGNAHVWLPMAFPLADQLTAPFASVLDIDATKDTVAGSASSFKFVDTVTGLALDVEGASSNAGARIVLAESSQAPSQIWSPEYVGNGAYQLKNANSGKILGTAFHQSDPGFEIEQVEAGVDERDVVTLTPLTGAIFRLYHDKLRMSFGVTSGAIAGAPVELVSSSTSSSWRVELVP